MKIPFWVSPLGYLLTKDNDDDDDDDDDRPSVIRKKVAKPAARKCAAKKASPVKKSVACKSPSRKVSADVTAARKFLTQVVKDYGEDILNAENSKKLDRLFNDLPAEYSEAKDILMFIQMKKIGVRFYGVLGETIEARKKLFVEITAELKKFGLEEERAKEIVNVVPFVLGMKFN